MAAAHRPAGPRRLRPSRILGAGQGARPQPLARRILEAINNWFDELIGAAAESEWLHTSGIDGFTFVIEPRSPVTAEERPNHFRGIRFQNISAYLGDGREWMSNAESIEEDSPRPPRRCSSGRRLYFPLRFCFCDNLVLNEQWS